jgi:hypothetical protein
MAELPSFVSDQQLKYLGWMMNDLNSARVRVIALQSLCAIYKALARDKAKLNNFTSRFEGRFYEMLKDKDRHVSIEAIKLVTMLQVRRVAASGSPLFHDPGVRHALVEFAHHLLAPCVAGFGPAQLVFEHEERDAAAHVLAASFLCLESPWPPASTALAQ